MPSKSPAQARLMAAVAHGWKPDRVHVPLAVAQEFVAADRRKSGKLESHQKHKGKERRKGY